MNKELKSEIKPYLLSQIESIKGYSLNERMSFIISEIMHNSSSHDGKGMFVGRFKAESGECYLTIASDATPFESEERIKKCLEPNTSFGGNGVQGSGMKLSMFQLKEDIDDAELIIHNKFSDNTHITVRSNIVDTNKANIYTDKEIGKEIKKAFELHKLWKDYNVFIFYKCKSGVLTKLLNYEENNRSYMGAIDLINYIMPKRGMVIKFDESRKSYISVAESRGARNNVSLIKAKNIENFVIDSEKFHFKDMKIMVDGKRECYIDGELELKIFPNFKTSTQIINLKSKKNENSIEKFSPVIGIGFNEDKFVSSDNNWNRVLSDSFYIGTAPSPIYNNMGLGYISKNYALDKSKLKEYEYIKFLGLEDIVEDITSWNPEMQAFIRINKISYERNQYRHDVKDVKDCLPFLPSLNAFFKCDIRQDGFNLCKDIASHIFDNDFGKIEAFKKRMIQHFPFNRTEGLPMKSFEQMHKNSKIVDAFDINGDVIRKVSVNSKYSGIKLKIRSLDTDIYGEISVVGSKGTKTSQLSFIWDEEELEYTINTEKRPNKVNFIKIDGTIYRLGFICDIGKKTERDYNGKNGGGKNRNDNDNYTFENYIYNDEEWFFVQCDGVHSKINRNQKYFDTITKSVSADVIGIQRKWDEVCEEINKRSIKLWHLYNRSNVVLGNEELKGKYGESVDGAINMALHATYLNEDFTNEFSKLYKEINREIKSLSISEEENE